MAGVDVDARGDRGWTALMHAVNKGYTLLVEPLLAADVDADVRAPDGATALLMATVHGHTEIIALLMEVETNISVRGPKGKMAVVVAQTRYGDTEAARQSGEPVGAVSLLEGRILTEEECRRAKEGRRLARKWPVGTKLRDCGKCPESVVVPTGTYEMGSERGSSDETHEVRIGYPFAMSVYEVTFGEWDACVSGSGGGCRGYRPSDSGWGRRGHRPVVSVSWDDAKVYVRWLSRKTGKNVSVVERIGVGVHGASGGGDSLSLGDEIGRDRANCIGCEGRWDGKQTELVGSSPPNGFGLHDVYGNVREWAEDCYHDKLPQERHRTEGPGGRGLQSAGVLLGGMLHMPVSSIVYDSLANLEEVLKRTKS